ncbi:hypothetical protein LTS17_005940 [Exophiala oligosperma]
MSKSLEARTSSSGGDWPRQTVETLDSGNGAIITPDELFLAELGHVQHMTRKFGFWSMLSLAFSIAGTWVALSADLGAGLNSGGTVSLIWGVVLAGLCMYCIAASLGELLSCYPTSLGQAFFVLKLAPEQRGMRTVSYITGWINVAGWWTLIASCATFTTSFFVAIIQIFQPDYSPKPWQNFVIFEATIWIYAVVNITLTRYDRFLPVFNTTMMITNVLLFVGMLVSTLACTAKYGTFQSGKFIFATFVNESGWPDGFAFLQGLLSATYGFTALDSVIHMIEELPKPSTNGPRTMVLAVWAGLVTGFIFLVVMFACTKSMDGLVNTTYVIPIVQILYDSTGQGGAATLMILLELNTIVSALSISTAASRLTYGFARDHGLPWSNYFAHTSTYWKMPVRATIGQTFIVTIIGVFYFCSSNVLTAVISLSSVTLVLACAVPVAVLLFVGRDRMPANRPYNLGRFRGYVYNIVGVAFASLISVVFFFPSSPNPSSSNMNWAIAAFGALTLLAVFSWFMGANRRYSVIPTTEDL